MRFEIPAHLIPRLRAMQSNWRNKSAKAVGLEDAVRLFSDFGKDTYMTFDGRFIIDPWLDQGPLYETSDPKEAYSAFLLGAKQWEAPWLLEMLPTRPGNAPDCEVCKGRGFVRLPSSFKDAHGKPAEIVCQVCGGLGWLTST
jgi:hypothetical protein